MTPDRRSRLILVAAAAVFAVGAGAVLSYPAHHDLAWLLYVAGRLVDGGQLYTGIVEVNPPLIIWLSAVPELIARATGAWNVTVYRVLVLAAAAVSIVLSHRQVRRIDNESVAGFADLLTLLLCYLLVARPGWEFGQREHLAVILVLPFMMLAARQVEAQSVTRAEDIVAGLLAGLGFAIKPHFLLAWLLIELYVLIRRRGAVATLPHGAVVVVFALYGAAMLVFERDYFALVHLASEPYAQLSRSSPAALLTLPAARWSVAAVLLAWLVPRRARSREALRLLGLATAAFLAVVLAQSKGWVYHWIPAVTLAAVILPLAAWAWLVELWGRGRAAAASRYVPFAVAAALALFAFGKFADADAHRVLMRARAYRLPQLIDVVERYARGGPIAALSTNMQAGFPLVNYTDVEWALRFNMLWLLPGSYPEYLSGTRVEYHPLDRMPAAERYMFDAVIEDLVRARPTLIIVDRLPPGYLLEGFDYLTYFGRDARFAALMRSYREVGAIERYRIFVRG